MNKEQQTRLINTLSVPTFVGSEDRLVTYICDFLRENNIEYHVDKYNNVYATKGTSDIYPCVVAHTDTVHVLDDIIVKQEDNKLFAVNSYNQKTGIGGDNKAGVFVCLELLLTQDILKAGFFVSEEVGCIGSKLCDLDFMQNVGYFMQFDAPFNNWVSQFSDGVKLFSKDSSFFKKINPIFKKNLPNFNKVGYGYHPYTDVSVLGAYFNRACVNYSVGYYNMHTKNEYVIIDDVELCLNVAKKLLLKLGYEKYIRSGGSLIDGGCLVDVKYLEDKLNKYRNK
jgi:tripeptide aminopeptidase